MNRANIFGSRFGEIIKECIKEKWDAVLVSELNMNTDGIRSYSHEKKNMFLIHSKKTGIILSKEMYNAWQNNKRKWYPCERTTTIVLKNLVLTAVYQPVFGSDNYDEEIWKIRTEIERVMAITPKTVPLFIGGDFNAQIGRSTNNGNRSTGNFGLVATNQQGEDLKDWLNNRDLCWVNSFFFVKRRGTWYNRSHNTWHEIDGFITRINDRHLSTKKVCIQRHNLLSDHNPVVITLNKSIAVKLNKRSNRHGLYNIKKNTNINWEKLMDEDKAIEYNLKTQQLNSEIPEEDSWEKATKIMMKAAKEVCGAKRSVINPWMNLHTTETETLKSHITELLLERNVLINTVGIETTSEEHREQVLDVQHRLKNARKEYKKKQRQWENDWWNNLAEECRVANSKGQIGLMYNILKKLQLRWNFNNSKNILLFTEEEFKNHLKIITQDRYEHNRQKLIKLWNL